MRYLVQAAWVDTGGVVELPDDATVLNAFYHPVNGALGVAVLKELPDKIKENKEEGKEEDKEKVNEERKGGEGKSGEEDEE